VGSITKGLFLAEATGTPKIRFALFKIDFIGGLLSTVRLGHRNSPSVFSNLSEEESLDKVDSTVALFLSKGIFMTERVEIYTDGACSGNPGPGGWGVILRFNDVEKELSGFDPTTTNNRMELKAAIEGIKALKRSVKVDLYSDSQYLRDGITKWVSKWKQNNWRLSNKKPVKNQDLWEELEAQIQTHTVNWHWVKGHAGHPENERADALAREAIKDALKSHRHR